MRVNTGRGAKTTVLDFSYGGVRDTIRSLKRAFLKKGLRQAVNHKVKGINTYFSPYHKKKKDGVGSPTSLAACL